MSCIVDELKALEKTIINWRRDLHRIPELGLELPKTAAYVRAVLEKLGIPCTTMVGGSAIVGLIEGRAPASSPAGAGARKTIALRADMDALPIQEETGLSFAADNGRMHACGHDGHTAMLLGAASVLMARRDDFAGTVKLFFQPGEEFPGGAKPMIEEGAMENPKVDAVLALHEGNLSPLLPEGSIGVCYGPMMAAMDRIYIKVRGKGAHGAYPETSVDPIHIASQIVCALQAVVSRETAASEPIVVSVTRIAGGINQNIIPAEVELEGTVRTLNHATRDFAERRIKQIAEGVAKACRAECDVLYDRRYPPLVNDAAFTQAFVESAKKIIPTQRIREIKTPSMGGEDMAYFLERAPGTFFYLSNAKPVDGKIYPHHNARFDVDESWFWLGSALLTQAALDWLCAPDPA